MKLEGENQGNVHLALEPFLYQALIQVIEARLVVGTQLINRYGCHLSCHSFGIGLGQGDGFTFLDPLEVRIGGLELFLTDAVGFGDGGVGLATLHLVLVVAAAHALIGEGQGSVGNHFDFGASNILVGSQTGIVGKDGLYRGVVMLGDGVDVLTFIDGLVNRIGALLNGCHIVAEGVMHLLVGVGSDLLVFSGRRNHQLLAYLDAVFGSWIDGNQFIDGCSVGLGKAVERFSLLDFVLENRILRHRHGSSLG